MKVEDHIRMLETERRRPDVSLETDRTIEIARTSIDDDLWYLDSPEGFKQHTQDFLRGIYEQQSSVDDESICNCAHPFCAPKNGELPHRVREASEFGKALDRYRMSHNNPEWIRNCRDAWRDRRSRVKKALRLCRMAARNDDPSVLEPVLDDDIEIPEVSDVGDGQVPEMPTQGGESDE